MSVVKISTGLPRRPLLVLSFRTRSVERSPRNDGLRLRPAMTAPRVFLLLLLALLPINFATSETNPDVYAFSTTADTVRFNTLLTQFRCVVCQNESLADSNAAIAADLRQQIYNRVLEGQSNEAIRRYLVARYGDYVLFEPPFGINTTALWILPFLLLMGSVMSLCIIIQRRKKRT